MGCKQSTQAQIKPTEAALRSTQLSGLPVGSQRSFVDNSSVNSDESSVSEWRIKKSVTEARQEFVTDGSLSADCSAGQLEFRALLGEQVCQPYIGNFAKESQGLDYLLCWIDMQEFKSIEASSLRLNKALLIYNRYLASGHLLDIVIDKEELVAIQDALSESKAENSRLPSKIFRSVQNLIFDNLYYSVFVPFKKSEEYMIMTKTLKESYNFVRVDDFDYIRKIGQGGFGLVVHCIKKSTKQHYAMKIQTKRGLLSCFPDDPWRVDYERQALVRSTHPFIVNLEYAFQTDSMVIMVLGLGTCGDLRTQLRLAPEKVLSNARVQFYAAEMACALHHLHSLGLIYRDLKPNNVLLTAEGHIQLVDLGAVSDIEGMTLGRTEFTELSPIFDMELDRKPTVDTLIKPVAPAQMSPASKYEVDDGDAFKVPDNSLFTGANAPQNSVIVPAESLPTVTRNDVKFNFESIPENSESRKPLKRAQTIIGTYGYMAPEMVVILSQDHTERVGYTFSVDWWSFGATIYKLLTNEKPFAEFSLRKLVEAAPTFNGDMKFTARYAILFQDIPEHPNVSPAAYDIIRKCLNVDGMSRLGADKKTGFQQIKSHPFFDGINWDLLEAKLVDPPYIPPSKALSTHAQYASFADMMKCFGKESWVMDAPKWNQQRYFAAWDYTSPNTLKLECNVAAEMRLYDTPFKSGNENSPPNSTIGVEKAGSSGILWSKSSLWFGGGGAKYQV